MCIRDSIKAFYHTGLHLHWFEVGHRIWCQSLPRCKNTRMRRDPPRAPEHKPNLGSKRRDEHDARPTAAKPNQSRRTTTQETRIAGCLCSAQLAREIQLSTMSNICHHPGHPQEEHVEKCTEYGSECPIAARGGGLHLDGETPAGRPARQYDECE
eukprot:5879763-Alexandrium_andersonii.AAC.1